MKREKLYDRPGMLGSGGRPRPMSGHEKANLMRRARVLMRRTEERKHYGVITAKHVAVLGALLYEFHNAATGLCFPSYDSIAEKADCARSTVHQAIKALEAAGLLTWVHRIKRVYETVLNLFGQGQHGQRSRVERTSNGYRFSELPSQPPVRPMRPKSEVLSGTAGQVSFPLEPTPQLTQKSMTEALRASAERLFRSGAGRARL